MKAGAKKRKTSMEWIKKYLLEGKFMVLCIPYSQPTQDLEIIIQLLFAIFCE